MADAMEGVEVDIYYQAPDEGKPAGWRVQLSIPGDITADRATRTEACTAMADRLRAVANVIQNG